MIVRRICLLGNTHVILLRDFQMEHGDSLAHTNGLDSDVLAGYSDGMKTTVDVNDSLIAEAMRLYGVKTKTRIIEMGLEALIRANKRSCLAEAFGSQPELIEPRRKR